MAQYLPESGTIGLGMARHQWNDNGPNPVTSISLGGSQCRSFAQKPSGSVKMSDLYARYRGYKMQFFGLDVRNPLRIANCRAECMIARSFLSVHSHTVVFLLVLTFKRRQK